MPWGTVPASATAAGWLHVPSRTQGRGHICTPNPATLLPLTQSRARTSLGSLTNTGSNPPKDGGREWCNSPTASKFLLHILKISQKIQFCPAPAEIAVALPSRGSPTPAPPWAWKPLRRCFWLGTVSNMFHIQEKVDTQVSHYTLLLEEKKTNNKPNKKLCDTGKKKSSLSL